VLAKEPMGSFASTVPLMDGESDELLPVLADNPNRRYLESARVTRRHPNEVVILLVGHSGHGKSKTINRLIGQELLEVGRSNSGSTTKVRQTWNTFQALVSSGLCTGHPEGESPRP
jgi:hypothetical protein